MNDSLTIHKWPTSLGTVAHFARNGGPLQSEWMVHIIGICTNFLATTAYSGSLLISSHPVVQQSLKLHLWHPFHKES